MFDIDDVLVENELTPIGDISSVPAHRVLYDIEGGLTYSSDVIQIATITTTWDFKIIAAKASYYRNYVPIAPAEYKVHGLTEEFLWSASDTFFVSELTMYPFYPTVPTMYITYGDFDIRKIEEQCVRGKLPMVDFGPQVSALTMKPEKTCHFDAFILSGRRLMQNMTPELRSRVQAIKRELAEFMPVDSMRPHDAVYDTMVLLALCKELVSNE